MCAHSDSPASDFLEKTEVNAHLGSYLADRSPADLVLCDTQTRELAAGRTGDAVVRRIDDFTWQDVESLPSSPESLSVFTFPSEIETVAHLRRTRPSALRTVPVVGLLHDVYPRVTATTDIMNQYGDLFQRPFQWPAAATAERPATSYLIAACPRTGTHFLCDLLATAGMGRPKEHVKKCFAYVFSNRRTLGFDPNLWFRQLVRFGTEDDVFGTKIVDGDFFRHFDDINACGNIFPDLFTHVILVTRADKVMQAISVIRARRLNAWHRRGQAAPGTPSPPYDFEELLTAYRFLVDTERRISDAARKTGLPCLQIAYKELTTRPIETIRTLAGFLGRPVRGKPSSREQKIRRRSDRRLARQFVRDYRLRFGTLPARG